MRNQVMKMLRGPHVLNVGEDGVKTTGITVQSVLPKKVVEDRGLLREWSINNETLANADVGFWSARLGMTVDAFLDLQHEVASLVV